MQTILSPQRRKGAERKFKQDGQDCQDKEISTLAICILFILNILFEFCVELGATTG